MTGADEHTCKTCATPLPSPESACPACVTAALPSAEQRAETQTVVPPAFEPYVPPGPAQASPDAPTLTPSPLPFPRAANPSPLPFPNPDSTTDMLLGMVFGGCLLEEKIGQGGMGAIYRAHHQALDRVVVVKILPPASTSVPEYRERFVREAQAAARLSHPNVVHVYNVGDERGLLFYVMELIDGESLDAVSERGPVAPLEAVRLIREAAKGLGAAHDEGIIHRDVKAANILRTSKGEVKVTDFGVACDLTKERLSGSGMLLGTPAYMAPEQAQGHGDARSDLYSLGVTLFQLLTTRLPFEGDTFMRVLEQHKSATPPSPAKLVPGIPESVCAVVAKLLRKDPARRYPQVATLVADLDAVIDELGGGAPFRPREQRSPLPLIVGIVGLAALTATWQWGRAHPPPSPAPLARVTTRDVAGLGPAPTDPEPPVGAPLTIALETPRTELRFRTPTARFTASLTGDLPDDLELTADGQPVVVTDRLCSVVVPGLREGEHVVRLSASSGDAELAALGVAVSVDLTPPELTATAPTPLQVVPVDGLDDARALALSIVARDRSPLRLSARVDRPGARPAIALTAGEDSYTGTLSLRPAGADARTFVGRLPIVVTARDAAGNQRELRLEVVVVPAGMVFLPGGPYRTGSTDVGSSSPPRSFETSPPLFVDVYEVTNRRYQAFVDAGGGTPPRSSAWRDGHYVEPFAELPVQGVSYLQAARFATWSGGRVPSEVEWEKAAAWNAEQMQNTRYPWGPDMRPEWANTQDCWPKPALARATPVGQFARDKSPVGCYDMCGNVQEWATHGGPQTSTQLLKGGCYLNRQAAASTTRREVRAASATLEQVGFRCVRDLNPGEQPDR